MVTSQQHSSCNNPTTPRERRNTEHLNTAHTPYAKARAPNSPHAEHAQLVNSTQHRSQSSQRVPHKRSAIRIAEATRYYATTSSHKHATHECAHPQKQHKHNTTSSSHQTRIEPHQQHITKQPRTAPRTKQNHTSIKTRESSTPQRITYHIITG